MANLIEEPYTIFECQGVPIVSLITEQGDLTRLPSFFEGAFPTTLISDFYLNACGSNREEALSLIKKDYEMVIRGIKRFAPFRKNLVIIQCTRTFIEGKLFDIPVDAILTPQVQGYYIEMILGLGGFYFSEGNESQFFNECFGF